MPEQLRKNEGKPRLTYAFVCYNAFLKLHTYEPEEDLMIFPLNLDEVLFEITRYLSRKDAGQDSLMRALIGTCQLLQLDLGGLLPPNDREQSAVTYVFRCDRAWDEFAKVSSTAATTGRYPDGNFRQGATVRHYLDSALRHLRAALLGATTNDDGCHTLANCLWNIWMCLDQPEFRDDRLQALNEGPEAEFDEPETEEYVG